MADNGTEIGQLYYDIDAPSDKLDKSLDQSDKKVKNFGDSIAKNGDKIKSALNKTAVTAAAVGAGIGLITKNATDFTVKLVKDSKALSREIGVTQVEASRLTAAFGRMGIESEAARTMFGLFSKQITASTRSTEANKVASEKLSLQIGQTKRAISDISKEIKDGGDKSGELNAKLQTLKNTLKSQELAAKQSGDAFDRLGVKTQDASGKQRAFTDILFDTADKFKAMPDGVDKTTLALELFGRSGRDMIKVLNLGGDGIRDLQEKADQLGLTLTEDTISKVNEFVQSQKDLKDSTDAMKIAIGTATAPILTEFNQALNDVILKLVEGDGPLKTITASFFAFAPPVFTGIAALAGLAANLVTVAAAFPKAAAAMALFSKGALAVLGPVGLLVAGLAAVAGALNSVKGAWDAVNNAQSAADNLGNPGQIAQLQKQAAAARKRGDSAAVKRYASAISAIGGGGAIGGNAEGTDNWRGGPTWVGEKGPEIIDLPKGSRVIPNDISKEMMKPSVIQKNVSVRIGQVNDKSDADYIIRRVNRDYDLESKGAAP